MSLDHPSFFFGFILGFLVAGVLGWILQRVRQTMQDMGAPNRPMMIATNRTPNDVVRASGAAFWRLIGWFFLLFCGLGIAGWLLYQVLLLQ